MKKPTCDSYGCTKKVAVLFKGTNDPETWVMNQCDVCLDEFCKDCCEWDDDQQKNICIGCYQQAAIIKVFGSAEKSKEEL